MKSNVSDFLELVDSIYLDATTKCSADVFDLRDLKTIRSRVEHEGISFLTITLPRFANDFERSLASGKIASTAFTGFNRVRGGSIPELFQGMTKRVFNEKTGEVICDDPQIFFGDAASDIPTIVESVRQICLTFKKVELECTPERVHSSLNSFIEIEHNFDTFSLQDQDRSKFLELSDMLWGNMVASFTCDQIIPRHGPGATADQRTGNGKYVWHKWYDRLEPYFPFVGRAYPLGIPAVINEKPFRWIAENPKEFHIVSIVPEYDEQPVKVVQVPKTLKAPRIIAIEPCCMQYAQQGIRDWLYAKIESYWLSRGHVNFRDQSVNQRLAITSSIDGQLATIDLSDASDRVPHDLALSMFRTCPELADAVEACRSRSALLPDGRLVSPLRKFASMGSALCFPVEAMYFYTLCIMASLDSMGLSYTPRNIFDVSRNVYVYGDDIIVPSANADVVIDYLQKYNCKVNSNKSFWTGKFRESCGVDAYEGMEVTPTYIRQLRPDNKQQADRIVSWVATANLFYRKGYWNTTSLMFKIIEDLIGDLPYVTETSAALGRISFLGYQSVERWNDNLQRFEIRAFVPRPVYRTDPLEGYGALTKYFLNPGKPLWSITRKGNRLLLTPSESQDSKRFERSARHAAVALSRRWALPH